tara:strand:- start:222 stop:1067 length:846 start_codon:yes stop_codon:yes gene_type:complete
MAKETENKQDRAVGLDSIPPRGWVPALIEFLQDRAADFSQLGKDEPSAGQQMPEFIEALVGAVQQAQLEPMQQQELSEPMNQPLRWGIKPTDDVIRPLPSGSRRGHPEGLQMNERIHRQAIPIEGLRSFQDMLYRDYPHLAATFGAAGRGMEPDRPPNYDIYFPGEPRRAPPPAGEETGFDDIQILLTQLSRLLGSDPTRAMTGFDQGTDSGEAWARVLEEILTGRHRPAVPQGVNPGQYPLYQQDIPEIHRGTDVSRKPQYFEYGPPQPVMEPNTAWNKW